MPLNLTKEAARERMNARNEEIAGLDPQIQERERALPLRERVKNIFKKYGVTVLSITLAAGAVIAAIYNALVTKALKAGLKALGNGLKEIRKKNCFLDSRHARRDCFFPFQNCRKCPQFSGRARLAVDFGCGWVFD